MGRASIAIYRVHLDGLPPQQQKHYPFVATLGCIGQWRSLLVIFRVRLDGVLHDQSSNDRGTLCCRVRQRRPAVAVFAVRNGAPLEKDGDGAVISVLSGNRKRSSAVIVPELDIGSTIEKHLNNPPMSLLDGVR